MKASVGGTTVQRFREDLMPETYKKEELRTPG
jgi:hypothetical protein